MSARWLRARADARVRLRSWLVLAVLTGALSGAIAAAGAGAVRTWSVYDRFLAATNGADAFVALPCEGVDDETCAEHVAALGGLSSVAAVSMLHNRQAPVTDTEGNLLNPSGDLCYTGTGELSLIATADGHLAADVNRIQVIDGRLPAPSDPDAVVVSKPFADRTGIGVGDRMLLHLDAGDVCEGDAGWGTATEVRVAAIGLMHGQVKPESGFYLEMIHLTPARSLELGDRPWSSMALVDLEGWASTERFASDLEDSGIPGEIALSSEDLSYDIENGLGADITTLTLVAGIAGIGVVLVIGAAIVRQASLSASDARTLWALGWARRDLTRLGLLEGSILGAVAATLCVLTAFLLSPLTPLGEARHIDPAGLFHFEARVVGPAAAAAWLLCAASYAIGLRRAAARVSRTRPRTRNRAWMDRLVSGVPGLPFTVSTGCRLAGSSGRERDVVPIRTGTTGITLGLVGIVGALTFVASLDHLQSSPRLVGWNWDAASFLGGEGEPEQLLTGLLADPDVEAAGYGTFWPPTADGGPFRGPGDVTVWPMSFSTGPNAIRPTVISGRAPEGPDEVAVSTGLAFDLGLDAGDSLELSAAGPDGNDRVAVYEVVGTTVLPVGDGNIGGTVALTFDGIARIGTDVIPQMVFTDLESGADWAEVAARAGVTGSIGADELVGEEQLTELIGLDPDRMRQAPQLLAVLLGVMVIGVLSHLVATTVTHRRQELAVLRALGCSGRQTRATVAWLVTIVAASTLLLAIPIGLFFGSRMWIENATYLHIFPETAVPWAGLLLLVPVTLVIANFVALVAGRRLTRLAAVDNLRSE